MAVPAVSSTSQDCPAPHWRTAASTARRLVPGQSSTLKPGSRARAWTYSLGLAPALQRLALALAYFAGPDGAVTASRASIGAQVVKKSRKGITARQVQRGLADLIRLGFAIEGGWHVHGYRTDGRPIRTRRYWLPIGTPRELLVEATPLTEVKASFRQQIRDLVASQEDSECHSLEPPGEAASEIVESDIPEAPKGHLEAEMSHNPKDRLESENQSLADAAREADDPPARAPIEYHGADPLNRLYARHGIDASEPPTVPPVKPAPSPAAPVRAAAALDRSREGRLLGLYDQTYLDRLKKDHAKLKNRGRP